MRQRLLHTLLISFLATWFGGCTSSNPTSPEPRSQSADDLTPSPREHRSGNPILSEETGSKPRLASAGATRQRWILLGNQGPQIMDLVVTFEQQSLEAALLQTVRTLAAEAGLDPSQAIAWNTVLDAPLIASGWLGNLVATPEQRAQLLALYDVDQSATADVAELAAFLTRGAARGLPIKLVHANTSFSSASLTAWGALDQDSDGEVTQREQMQAAEQLWQYDFDEDHLLTRAELTPLGASDNAMSGREPGLLDAECLLALPAPSSNVALRKIFDHYSQTETIPRTAWSHWSDDRLANLGVPPTTPIKLRDLDGLNQIPADLSLHLQLFPASLRNPALWSIESATLEPPQTKFTPARAQRLAMTNCVVTVTFRDDHSATTGANFEQQLRNATSDPAIRNQLITQLGLIPSALELLRTPTSEANYQSAWRWLTAVRDSQLTATWSMAELPWFDWLDNNADGRLNGVELSCLTESLASWDTDHDNLLQASEVPLAIRISVTRSNPRTAAFLQGGMTTEKSGITTALAPFWFLGMDYNSDGCVTRTEFLGNTEDFDRFDLNRDGLIDDLEATSQP